MTAPPYIARFTTHLYNFARRVGTCVLHVRGTKKQLWGLPWVTQRTCDPWPLGRQAMRKKYIRNCDSPTYDLLGEKQCVIIEDGGKKDQRFAMRDCNQKLGTFSGVSP